MTARGRAAACAKGRRKDGMLVNVKRNIPFSPPDISQAEIDEVADALRSGWITTGPKTKQFERDLAEFSHTTRFACFNSATAALECALRALDIGPGDEVITSAYTYTASASPIVHVGATPVLCDVAPGSFEIDYDQVASLVTENTRAIIPVDVAGVMCDYDRLRAIVRATSGIRARRAKSCSTVCPSLPMVRIRSVRCAMAFIRDRRPTSRRFPSMR